MVDTVALLNKNGTPTHNQGLLYLSRDVPESAGHQAWAYFLVPRVEAIQTFTCL